MQQRVCARCGTVRTDDVDSNICGNCADDLRMEQDAHLQEQLSDTGFDQPKLNKKKEI